MSSGRVLVLRPGQGRPLGGGAVAVAKAVALGLLLVAMAGPAASAQVTTASNVIYISTNDPVNGNAVLAFRVDPATCMLTPLGSFPTGGTGVGNPNFRLGTLDEDQSLIISDDGRRLFVVNAGSDSIAVFTILPNGALVPAPGSPFLSGGHMPVSLGLAGNTLYVEHKNEVPGEDPTFFPPPNITAFRINFNGALTPLPSTTIVKPQGSSPTQALTSRDGRFLFSSDLLVNFPPDFFPTDGFPDAPGAGGAGETLESYLILPNGKLKQISEIPIPEPDAAFPDPLGLLSGSMHVSGTTNAALGLQLHPTRNILYAGFPLRFQLGVYSFDPSSGALKFENVVPNAGAVICWIQIDDNGKYLYTSNQLSQSVSVYDLANPLAPVEIDQDPMTEGTQSYRPPSNTGGLFSQEYLTDDGKCLYVLEQRVTDTMGDMSKNLLHVLRTNTPSAGRVTEVQAIDLQMLGVSPQARPLGVFGF